MIRVLRPEQVIRKVIEMLISGYDKNQSVKLCTRGVTNPRGHVDLEPDVLRHLLGSTMFPSHILHLIIQWVSDIQMMIDLVAHLQDRVIHKHTNVTLSSM